MYSSRLICLVCARLSFRVSLMHTYMVAVMTVTATSPATTIPLASEATEPRPDGADGVKTSGKGEASGPA